jgi:1-acyl-sn-glycerol-3-phosphate acyltransferase
MNDAIRAQKARAFYQLAKATAGFGMRHLYYRRFDVEGHENIPQKGPFLMLPYHDSMLNVLELGTAVQRTLVFVARTNPFSNPVVKFALETYMHGAETIFFDRDRPSVKNLREVYSGIELVIRENLGLVIFPEATRNREGIVGRIDELRIISRVIKTKGRYGEEIPVPVIPVGIDAERSTLRGGVTVRFSQPVYASGYGSIEKMINDHVMPTIAELSGKPYDKERVTFYAEAGLRADLSA